MKEVEIRKRGTHLLAYFHRENEFQINSIERLVEDDACGEENCYYLMKWSLASFHTLCVLAEIS
jgi:hypothetical protein